MFKGSNRFASTHLASIKSTTYRSGLLSRKDFITPAAPSRVRVMEFSLAVIDVNVRISTAGSTVGGCDVSTVDNAGASIAAGFTVLIFLTSTGAFSAIDGNETLNAAGSSGDAVITASLSFTSSIFIRDRTPASVS